MSKEGEGKERREERRGIGRRYNKGEEREKDGRRKGQE